MGKSILLLILLATAMSYPSSAQSFDIQGHRGCRGLMPENSIPGFLKAIDLGVTTLELDVVISGDGKVVVSHDSYFSSTFCVNELGLPLDKKDEQSLNIYRMDYEDIRMFDCGIRGNKDFPEQQAVSTYKPLLTEMLLACEEYAKSKNLPQLHYNIELKSGLSGDNIHHPEPHLFTKLVYEATIATLPLDRFNFQSFDPRILQFCKAKYPEVKLALLVPNAKAGLNTLEELDFKPDIYSPHHKILSQEIVDEMHQKSIAVIPWTVNSANDMERVIGLGVDGLITDFPDRYFQIRPSNR
ncbi:MAG: glycerophosphodiester phosphodiesterase family protein [Cyclobacteriaceae bacterium]|nr:glycerophosphodiester phosphodiesterase family protein [Cyclobacteriaceae bacterium]